MKTTTIKADDGREVRVSLDGHFSTVTAGTGPRETWHLPAWLVRALMGHGAEQAALAKLAESTEWGSRACEVLGYVLGTLNLCDDQHWAFDPMNVEPVKDKAVAVRLLVIDLKAKLAEAGETAAGYLQSWNSEADRLRKTLHTVAVDRDSLRSRVAKLEAVAEAARKCAQNPVAVHDALRALDDSGGSGRIPGSATREAAHASSSGPEPGPEPAGSSTDSPVGVVATAEGPGPGPLCAKCGAPIGYCRTVCARDVEDAERVRVAARSVTNGQVPEPPETAREDGSTGAVACSLMHVKCANCGGWRGAPGLPAHECPPVAEPAPAPEPPPDYITRAELVAAVRSAASAVGGPPRRAPDTLAEALENGKGSP